MANDTPDIGRLARWPRRIARRKGFGIHSPFAFDFVRRVIAQPCDYYAYETIAAQARSASDRRLARLLFRVVLFFRPERIAADTPLSPACLAALKTAMPAAATEPSVKAPQLIIVSPGSAYTTESLTDCISRGGTVLFNGLHRGNLNQMSALWRNTEHGMLFRGRSVAVMAGLTHLPHQKFDVWI